MGLLDALNQFMSSGSVSEHNAHLVVQSAPSEVLGPALAATFRSEDTPPIGHMVGQLFGSSDAQQRSGLINQILATLGPAAATSLAGGVLGRVLSPGASQVTPDQASGLTPDDVTAVVNEAHAAHAGLADQLGSFYAQHAELIKTLGGAALLVAAARMHEHLTER
jgi:hypothetical protein